MVSLPAISSAERRKELASLGAMIGDAPIVGLSEGVHLGTEPLELRNQLFDYLVKEKGFTTIAIESGLVEGRRVHDHVRDGEGDLERVVAQGFSWTFDRLPQNVALVRWMRQYNQDSHHIRKINFYGFDVPGSPGNPGVHRGPDTALEEALRYLESVDGAGACAFRARLEPLLKNLRFDLQRPADTPGYDRLTSPERDVLTACIADLVTLLERRESQYSTRSTADGYAWAYRVAIGARQIDAWLRQIPVGWHPSTEPIQFPSEQTRFLAASLAVRDRAQADNLEWILQREGADGKVLVYGHLGHLSAAPVVMDSYIPEKTERRPQDMAGTYLRRRFGERYLAIGNLVGGGEVGYAGVTQPLGDAPRDSMDRIAGRSGVPRFLLDLRTAPATVSQWLDQERAVGHAPAILRVNFRRAFDILFYVDSVTPASRLD